MGGSIYAPVIAGMLAGVGLVALFSIDYEMRNYDSFRPVTSREAFLITWPLDAEPENFDCNTWLEGWADDRNAHFVEIEGYKAAVRGPTIGLRFTDVVPLRAELAMCTEDYRFTGYGFVTEHVLIREVENALEYQQRFSE